VTALTQRMIERFTFSLCSRNLSGRREQDMGLSSRCTLMTALSNSLRVFSWKAIAHNTLDRSKGEDWEEVIQGFWQEVY